jgi:hypothetical protein
MPEFSFFIFFKRRTVDGARYSAEPLSSLKCLLFAFLIFVHSKKNRITFYFSSQNKGISKLNSIAFLQKNRT